MTLQLISLLVIIAVLVIDFIINGRKKVVDDTQKRIEGYEGLKKFNLAEYLIRRRKNIVIFILLVFLSKPIMHVSFFTETQEVVNYNKKIIENPYTKDYYLLNSKGDLIHQKDTIFLNPAWNNRYLSGLLRTGINWVTVKGEKYIKEEIGDGSQNIFYYPLETMPLNFNEHLEIMFKSKLWIFLVSIGVLIVIVFLFNDKIKAR
jgi:hypothetical protein